MYKLSIDIFQNILIILLRNQITNTQQNFQFVITA